MCHFKWSFGYIKIIDKQKESNQRLGSEGIIFWPPNIEAVYAAVVYFIYLYLPVMEDVIGQIDEMQAELEVGRVCGDAVAEV